MAACCGGPDACIAALEREQITGRSVSGRVSGQWCLVVTRMEFCNKLWTAQ